MQWIFGTNTRNKHLIFVPLLPHSLSDPFFGYEISTQILRLLTLLKSDKYAEIVLLDRNNRKQDASELMFNVFSIIANAYSPYDSGVVRLDGAITSDILATLRMLRKEVLVYVKTATEDLINSITHLFKFKIQKFLDWNGYFRDIIVVESDNPLGNEEVVDTLVNIAVDPLGMYTNNDIDEIPERVKELLEIDEGIKTKTKVETIEDEITRRIVVVPYWFFESLYERGTSPRNLIYVPYDVECETSNNFDRCNAKREAAITSRNAISEILERFPEYDFNDIIEKIEYVVSNTMEYLFPEEYKDTYFELLILK